MRDEQVRPRGWPVSLRARRNLKLGEWNAEWIRRHERNTPFRPENRNRRDGSDYNQHSVHMEASPEAGREFDRRACEILGRYPNSSRPFPEPDTQQRLRGALATAVIGDAWGRAVDSGQVTQRSWAPDYRLRQRGEPMTEYILPSSTVQAGAVSQLMAFTVEGLVRARVARSLNPENRLPTAEVQHAYQRWLFAYRGAHPEQWPMIGGPYAVEGRGPDGWLVAHEAMRLDGEPDPALVAELDRFASTGELSTPEQPIAHARGSEVVPRAALAAVASGPNEEVLLVAIRLAATTHDNKDDWGVCAALAVILRKQFDNCPFSECLDAAFQLLKRLKTRPIRVLQIIERAQNMLRNEWTPAPASDVIRRFGDGNDAVSALGIALYGAMCSDYPREALLLALNYAPKQRPVVAAIAGLLIGAECGVEEIPPDLRNAVPMVEAMDALAQDAFTAFNPNPPQDPAWLHRYPPT